MTTDGLDSLEREFEMVESAIAMVAGRHSPRVTIAGLRYGDKLIPEGVRMARAAGVRLVPLWGSDDGGADILVERDPDEQRDE